MSIWGRSIVLAVALVAALVAPAQAQAESAISVTAAEVTLPPGQDRASVDVSWHTDGDQVVQIWIRETGKAAKLWLQSTNGSATWPYLYADTTTTFELRAGPGFATVLDTAESTGRGPGRLSADRTRLALDPGQTGVINLRWATALTDAQVWVSHQGGPQKLYAQGPSGAGRITWISRGTTVFTLWSGTAQQHLLDTLVVTADSGATVWADQPVVVDPGGTGSTTVHWTGPATAQARLVNDDGTETVLGTGPNQAVISTRGADRKVVKVYEGNEVVTHTSVTVLRDARGWAGFNYLPEHEKRYQEYLDVAVWPQVRDQVARDFDVIASTGGTLARIVLWPELSGYFSAPAECVAGSSQRWCAQARNLVELAGIAKQRGIRIVPVFGNSYLTNPNWNSWPNDPDSRKKWAEFGVTSAAWMNTYITALESSDARDAVLYYDLQNETSGVRGRQPNLQSAYVAMVYDRTAAPRGKRGVSVMHATTDGADLAAALVGKPMDFVDVHGYSTLDLIDSAVRGLRERFPASTVLVGEIGQSTWEKGVPSAQKEREQADYTRRTLDTLATAQVPIAMAWELYDDLRTPPHPLSTGYGYLTRERAKEGFGVLCSRWSLVPDCGTLREATSAQPATLEVSTTIPVRPGVLTSNAILHGNGTARLVLTEFDAAGRELASTPTSPVAIGAAGLNFLRHQDTGVRLRDDTRSVRIAVRAEGSTQLSADVLTAGLR